jgi:zinc protease
MRIALRCLIFVTVLVGWVLPAAAVDIKEVTSPGGIKAWLVQDSTIPLIAMQFSFKGGAAGDPKGKEGLTHFVTGMLDEGAGPLDSAAFQAKREDLAVKMAFNAGLDNFEGSLQTLAKNRDEAFNLLKLALTAPHFDAEPFERVRQQFMIEARGNAEDPERISSDAWMKAAFGDHPYSRDSEGTLQSIGAITPDDLRARHKELFTRKGLLVSVVGDIDEETLKRLLDQTFGTLPNADPPPSPADVSPADGPAIRIIDRDIPQSIITFGNDGIKRDDEDFIAAYVMSFILGGGGFGSRLTDEVREKRGLTYGIGTGLYPLDHAGVFLGSVGTRNDKAKETIDVAIDVMRRFAEEGPTPKELEDAKTYLTGSYALRFDSNSKIADQLLSIQQDNLGIDYVAKRNDLINAVTLEDVKKQAKRIIEPGKLIITIVGRPQGVSATGNEG